MKESKATELQCQDDLTKSAKDRLENAKKHTDRREAFFKKPAAGEKNFTEYDAQILLADSIERCFAYKFARLIQGVRNKMLIKILGEEKL